MTTEAWKEEWDKRVADFAKESGKTVEEVEKILTEHLVGKSSEVALGYLSDPASVSDEDIKKALTEAEIKMPVAVLKAGIAILRGPKPEPKEEETETTGGKILGSDILPAVPDDDSFINILKTKGELRAGINETDVISVCFAINADRMDFYGLLERILKEMETVAQRTKKPYTQAYYELEEMLLKQTHSDVLKALGMNSRRHVSKGKRKDFLQKAKMIIWPALQDFLRTLKAWDEMYKDEYNDPRNLILAAQGKGTNEYPDPGMVYDAADAVKDKLNEVFIGAGIPNARCLAADAYDIKKAISDERLPTALGVADFEEMLELLGANVMGDALRHEKNLIKFVLGILGLKDVTPGDSELDYLRALSQVGRHILFPESASRKQSVSEEEFERY